MSERPLILTFDVEDWQQLVRSRLGLTESERPDASIVRQVAVILDTLEQMHVTATFFLLGATVRCHPEVATEIASRGHEIACHGDAHKPVYTQTSDEFRDDLARALERIERATGRIATGYRAPLFSINRDCLWAYDVLAESGFRYDASQHDSPRIPNRIRNIPREPYLLELGSGRSLFEFPVVVAGAARIRLPVGGGSYWRLLPARVLFRALRASTGHEGPATIYFHPYEWDTDTLRVTLPRDATFRQRAHALERCLWRNTGRRRIPRLVHEAANIFRLESCEQALAELACDEPRHRSLSQEGRIV